MNKLKTVCLAAAIASGNTLFAGGLLTNTNQNVAFNRMMSREASIGIDGVYYNPAGVVFMGEGHHLSLNWQLAYQTRTINNDYQLFTNNVDNPTTPRDFKGKAFARSFLRSNMPTTKAVGRSRATSHSRVAAANARSTMVSGRLRKLWQRQHSQPVDWLKRLMEYWTVRCSAPTRHLEKAANTVSTAICTAANTITVCLWEQPIR